MENMEPIYLDQDGYNEYLKNIEKLKKAIQANNMGRKEAFDAGAGDGWDSPEFEEKNDLQNAEYQHYDSDDCIDACHDDLRFG